MSDTFKKVIGIGAIVFLSALIGILLGQFFGNYETRYMFAREYCGDVNGIEIYAAGEIDRDNFVKHLEMLVKAPEKLTNCCEKMYFTGSGLDIPTSDSGLGSALGLTQDRTIYISTQSFSSYVVYHELFHAFDNQNDRLSETAEFTKLYAENERIMPVFAAHSEEYAAEFFAQVGAMYLLMPFELSVAAPDLYDYYDSTLGFGTDALK